MRTHLPRGATLGRAEEERGGQEQAGLGRVHSRRGPSLLPTPACGPARPSAASSRLRSSLTTPFWRLSGGEIQPGVHLCVYKSIFSFGNTYTLFFKKQTNKTLYYLHFPSRDRQDGRLKEGWKEINTQVNIPHCCGEGCQGTSVVHVYLAASPGTVFKLSASSR